MLLWYKSISDPALVSELSREDLTRLHCFRGWHSEWQKAEGDLGKFLENKNTRLPLAPSVRLIRERLLDVLKRPAEEKEDAVLSVGATLLASRHLNVGQCREIFEAIRNRELMSPTNSTATRISRPIMPGWSNACRLTEGGVGSTLHDFEENLVMRMVTYGQDETPIGIPGSFLMKAIVPVRPDQH